MAGIPDPYRVDPGPMRRWLTERMYAFQLIVHAISADALGAWAHQTPRQRLMSLLGWEGDAGDRRLHRWLNESDVIDRRDVEQALFNAGVDWFDVYPAPEDARPEEDDAEEEFCFACRAFVTPIDGCCAWCDRTVMRIDLRNLPPRPKGQPRPEPAGPVAPLTVKHRPRRPGGKPFYLDLDLVRRRRALEMFAETASIELAVAAIWEGAFRSQNSAYGSLRTLLVREGWYRPTGAKGPHAHPQLRDAAPRVRAALDDGSWDRPAPEPRSYRWVIDEALMREAAFMYFVDEDSFRRVAERLLPRSRSTSALALKSVINDEWNRRGWPRRTHKAAHAGYAKPSRSQRCRARTEAGKPCRRYAKKGTRFCFGHDPAVPIEVRREMAGRASAAAFPDTVPVEPFAFWLRHRRRELGSLLAVHRRVAGAISYDSLSDWARPWGDVGGGRARVVRRSTVDRILAAWGDGTTFEDVYMPVENDDAVLVPEAIAA